MASPSALIAMLLVMVVGCAAVASAMELSFIVGDAQGWNTGVDYTAWAKGKTFEANDTLGESFSIINHFIRTMLLNANAIQFANWHLKSNADFIWCN
jgi:hypothetical protein